jgi:hypothetical protein
MMTEFLIGTGVGILIAVFIVIAAGFLEDIYYDRD